MRVAEFKHQGFYGVCIGRLPTVCIPELGRIQGTGGWMHQFPESLPLHRPKCTAYLVRHHLHERISQAFG